MWWKFALSELSLVTVIVVAWQDTAAGCVIFRCGSRDHRARNCPRGGGGGGGGGGGQYEVRCYNCNKLGHIARDCTAK